VELVAEKKKEKAIALQKIFYFFSLLGKELQTLKRYGEGYRHGHGELGGCKQLKI